MKVALIVMAILSGWLFSEIKDFILNGGCDNKLATILLKVIFIVVGILICAFSDFNFEKFFLFKDKHEKPTPTPELDLNRSTFSRSNSKTRRKNRFTDFNLNSE
jgi:hypothetical protein